MPGIERPEKYGRHKRIPSWGPAQGCSGKEGSIGWLELMPCSGAGWAPIYFVGNDVRKPRTRTTITYCHIGIHEQQRDEALESKDMLL